jgi:hypothetical protein
MRYSVLLIRTSILWTEPRSVATIKVVANTHAQAHERAMDKVAELNESAVHYGNRWHIEHITPNETA